LASARLTGPHYSGTEHRVTNGSIVGDAPTASFYRLGHGIVHQPSNAIPEDRTQFEREMRLIIEWYNEHRPHETLDGKTLNEVHFSRPAANEQPRLEPRRKWPRGSPCATPVVGIEGDPGDPMVLDIDCLEGRSDHLRDRLPCRPSPFAGDPRSPRRVTGHT
jgi:hypothetical protein